MGHYLTDAIEDSNRADDAFVAALKAAGYRDHWGWKNNGAFPSVEADAYPAGPAVIGRDARNHTRAGQRDTLARPQVKPLEALTTDRLPTR